MSATALNWKYVGSAVPAANTVAGGLNALYTLGTATTYADGSSRTEGSGSAGTWTGNRYQNAGVTEAIWFLPPSNTHTVAHMWAGQASGGTKTPTMIGSPADTSATVTILYGFTRSAGALVAWDNATPLGGSFTGFMRACALGTFTIAKVHLFECQTGVVVVWATSTGMIESICGELLDPGVTNAQSPTTAELTTNCRYMIRMCGGTTATSTTSWTTSPSGSAATFFAHSTAANGNHCFVVSVGGVSLTAAERQLGTMQASTTSTQLTPDGDAAFRQILDLGDRAGGNWFGRLREMALGPDAKIGQSGSASGVAKAYAVSSHPTTDNDTLWLLA